MDTDEECSIVLQLSDNDPFFDEKKLELYFAEDDASVEFYSPRNELEALNLIVLVTDKSLSSCTHSHTNILQGLRQTVLDLISDFGDQKNMKGVIQKHRICEKEENLIEWGKSHGVKTQLKIAYVEGAGRGMIGGEDLKVGDIAIEIPVPLIISEELVLETDMLHLKHKDETNAQEPPHTYVPWVVVDGEPIYDVSVIAPNVPAIYAAHFAVPMAGTVLNTVNIRLNASTVAFLLNHCNASVVIVDQEFFSLAEEALKICLRQVSAKAVYEAISKYKVTNFCAAPVVLNSIMNALAEDTILPLPLGRFKRIC